MKIKYLFAALLLWSLAPSLNAQIPVFHLDKPLYVTGDILRYRLYLPPAFSGQDVALKTALVDAGGEPVGAFHQQTGGATALDGYLKLPYDLRSQVYHLLVLGTGQESRKKIKLAEILVPVYNDLGEESPPAAGPIPETGAMAEQLQVTIEQSGGPFQKQEEIPVQVRVTDRNGQSVPADLSVSVIDAGLFGGRSNGLSTPVSSTPAPANDLSDRMYLNGRITDELGRPRAEISFGAYVHDLGETIIGETDASGDFALELPTLTGSADIQFVDLRNDSLRVVLDDGIELSPTPPIPFNEKIESYLKWSRSRKVIYQLYNTLEMNLEQTLPERRPKPVEPDQRIVPSEYTAFKDMATFFTEVSTPLKFRIGKEGNLIAQMFNPNPRMRAFYQGTPIFLVDGKMTRDVDFVQQLELSRIDTIDLYFDFLNLNRYFGKVGSNGIAVLKTSIPNLQVPQPDENSIFRIDGLLASAREPASDQATDRRPDFRSNLYWNPTLPAANGTAGLRFTQSDDLGTFLIRVVARTADGRTGTAVQTYEVQW
ncbi:hypothetical protein [Flavilitoribacter nigricans]|uniref:Carboxypeptidase regulatory-like domain-containing protein n=1 Tax=Flavilitoribacter nigricans (strain ATCC 23147 / DSM 23189 / NBRC 102662 / NCIMB 1420 / SS-2) TaxID=1122177 RepID=A0A2D0NHE8_FLAN2|nr:hypothetical protein [Flavilitoribacter nigricans]PHN07922.1 hypothetical protein CRP01_03980 [Flavilitoribacter nigricans DSM 23189 = NBRC 102662]